ncbi:hypothetical protein B0H19DRAFT_365333 [Mycena capillaripes]|nr:hypothetical protein B0H19DRAFT_365333 [Mycena capillaripes]
MVVFITVNLKRRPSNFIAIMTWMRYLFVFCPDTDRLNPANQPTSPEFSWRYNGTHTFSWRTKHACPRALPPGAPGPPPEEPDTDPPAQPPVDPDADVEDRAPISNPASPSLLFVLFWISLSVSFKLSTLSTDTAFYRSLFALRMLYPFLSRWGRRLALRFSKAPPSRSSMRKGFRPSPSILVRWAAEENLEEYDIDEGFTRGFSERNFSDGEETPLTPNSKATFVASQYGSAG